ncbi:MAG: glycosyltransferase family 8 protein [Bacteroidia bacterium]|nr:glycosyltransferase family 8 protein [Bacteroidia bacterium]
MSKSINILCATDKNFVPYCGIMLTSLFENNKEEKLCVNIIVDSSVKDKDRKLFVKLGEQYHQQIELISVDESTFAQYPVYNKQWTNSIYYRLLAAELLPNTIDKLIYLDCDIVVNGHIREMWEINISNYAVGVVPDIWAPRQDVYERLDLKNDGLFFNSGSMLINLKYWREKKLREQFLDYIKNNFEKLWFNDQDTLNGVLVDQKLIIPVTYNYQIVFLQKTLLATFSTEWQKQILETTNPLIIHYAASTKPWMIIYYNMPFLSKWRYYRDISYWKKTPNLLPKTKVINWLIKRYICWPLHIMSKDDFIIR